MLLNQLRALWRTLNSSLWFVPTLMVAGAVVLSYVLVIVDVSIGHDWVQDYPLLFGAGADGARGVLTTIAGSMITVAALIFSLTLSTLAQVSSQYTPRVLHNFMRNRTNQVVLGFFVSIFVYCLLVLRTIRGGDEGRFIPSLAVAFGLVLALVSIGVLVFFIHHIASSIQAANIIRAVAEESQRVITELFPAGIGDAADALEAADLRREAPDFRWVSIPAAGNGYVLHLDETGILDLARRLKAIVRLEHGIGGFVARGGKLASVAAYGPEPLPPLKELTDMVRVCYSLGSQRTVEQDAGFGLRQIVDIALKALSPGVNDTTTAIIGIDYLGSLLAQLADRSFPSPYRTDDNDDQSRVRIIAQRPSFASYVATALDQVRIAGDGNVAVYLRLLTALATTAAATTDAGRRDVLRRQTHLVEEAATRTLGTPYERNQVTARVQQVLSLL